MHKVEQDLEDHRIPKISVTNDISSPVANNAS